MPVGVGLGLGLDAVLYEAPVGRQLLLQPGAERRRRQAQVLREHLHVHLVDQIPGLTRCIRKFVPQIEKEKDGVVLG